MKRTDVINIKVTLFERFGIIMILKIILKIIIIPYSAINKKANSALLNSVLNPLTSSLSDSIKSNGVRPHSDKIIIITGIIKINLNIISMFKNPIHIEFIHKESFIFKIIKITNAKQIS